MALNYILAPNARWQGRDQTGEPIVNGKLYTYIAGTSTPKATYQDYEGLQPNTNPVILDGKGEANIYWNIANGELYRIVLFDADDNEVYSQDNYPVVGTNTTEIVGESETNIVRNPQFYFWYYGANFTISGTGSQNNQDYICDDWLYRRVGTSYSVVISQQEFDQEQITVPGNPTYFLRYASATPSGETLSQLYQRYEGVRTLAGQDVSVSFYGKSGISSTSTSVQVYLVQNFGTLGSPENAIIVGTFTLTDSWELHSASVNIDALSNQIIGSDDALELRFKFLDDSSQTVDLCNVLLNTGETITNFPFQTVDTQLKELNNRVTNGLFTTSMCVPTLQSTANDGWLMCSDQTIGNVSSGSTNTGLSMRSLFDVIWSNVTDQFAPIYLSDGTLSSRGLTATEDWDAKKRLALTKTLGRVIASAGQGIVAQTFTADSVTDLLTVNQSDNIYYNATPVTLSTTGTLPAPLSPATTYYAVYISSTTIKLATTVANAVAGTYIDITDGGTGTHTITITYSNWSLGQFGGEQNHASTVAEMASHNHSGTSIHVTQDGTTIPHGSGGGDSVGDFPLTIASQGGSTAHNIMQPTVFLNYMIKL